MTSTRGLSSPAFEPVTTLWSAARTPRAWTDLARHDACDVVIVGGGFTGLWTALQLSISRPSTSIIVLDAVEPGHGASGRNGGWCTSELPLDIDSLAGLFGADRAMAWQRRMFSVVDDVGRAASDHGIECGWRKGGWLTSATSPAHEARLQSALADWRLYGFGSDDVDILDARASTARIAARGTTAGLYTPHCAVLDPGRLVDGLVSVLEKRGVRLCAGTRVRHYGPGRVRGVSGEMPFVVEARWVVRATEGYTASLASHRRDVLPLWSQMIATAPLGEDVWSSIGWREREAFSDGRTMIIYAQRTADDRIAFGGRGVGYRYASRLQPHSTSCRRTARRIAATMHSLFPATRDAEITHQWGGMLGVPRDWVPSVRIDRRARVVEAGGYVGNGVALSHLVGRIVADLVLGNDSPDVRLPLVDHRSRSWEPEPLRWLGLNVSTRLVNLADSIEARTGRPARRTLGLIDRVLG